jgi:hypothetical protein
MEHFDQKYDHQNLLNSNTNTDTDTKNTKEIENQLIQTFKNSKNLFSFAYEYHTSRGNQYFLLKIISITISITLVIGLIFFFTLCFNWSKFISTINDNKKNDQDKSADDENNIIIGFIVTNNWFLILMNILYLIYWLLVCYSQFLKIPKIILMRKFYRDILEISDQNVEYFNWSVIERIIIDEFEYGKLNFIFSRLEPLSASLSSEKTLTTESIRAYIHYDENFISYIFREDIINIKEYKNFYHSKLLVWLIQKIFVSSTTDQKNENNPAENLSNIKSKLRLTSVVLFLLLPCLILYHLFITCIKEVQKLSNMSMSGHLNKNNNNDNQNNLTNLYLAPKYGRVQNSSSSLLSRSSNYKWSNYARLTLRNSNEYLHETEARLSISAYYIEQTIACFPNYFMVGIMKIFITPLTLVIGLIVLVGLFSPMLLLSEKITIMGDYPLISVLTFITPLTLYFYQYIKNVEEDHSDIRTMKFQDKKQLLENLRLNNLIREDINKEIDNNFNIYKNEIDDDDSYEIDAEFRENKMNTIIKMIKEDATKLYQHKFYLFLSELSGVILLPYLFGFHFYNNIITITTALNLYKCKQQPNVTVSVVATNDKDGHLTININESIQDDKREEINTNTIKQNKYTKFNFNLNSNHHHQDYQSNLKENLLNNNYDDLDDEKNLTPIVPIGSYIPPIVSNDEYT